MTKKTIRLLLTLAVMLLVLVLLAGYFYYYKSTKKLSFDLVAAGAESAIPAPEFLYAFSGVGTDHLQRPIGIAYANGRVFVSDSASHTIYAYDESGRQLTSFGASQTATPLYAAINPKDGVLYVTDRGKRAVLKFNQQGSFLGEFKPNLPKDQLPKKTASTWEPLGISFGPDGTMYVTEVLNGHRLLIFGSDGRFQRSVGNLGIISDPTKQPQIFQFPNGVLYSRGEVYVADSNNRRLQVFTPKGDFKRMIVTEGLPRGMVDLEPFSTDQPDKDVVRIAVVDTLAHFVTIWGADGEKYVSFGEQGALDGQFSYPSAVARGTKNKLFVTDTGNGRVEVWGWPMEAASIPVIGAPTNLAWCLVPFLLLPLLLVFRKRRYYATADFVREMIALEQADLMPGRGRRWVTLEAEYESIKTLSTDSIDFGELFEATEFSESDARALREKYELDETTASTLAAAQRAKTFCTETNEYRRLAKLLELDVIDAEEFVRRFAKSAKPRTDSGSKAGE